MCFIDACYSVQMGGISRQNGIMQKQLISEEVECYPENEMNFVTCFKIWLV